MSLASSIAIYFVIWWVALFAVLPFGVRNAHEAGETVESGNEPGAPVQPMLLRKALITTAVATVVFSAFYFAKTQGWLGF